MAAQAHAAAAQAKGLSPVLCTPRQSWATATPLCTNAKASTAVVGAASQAASFPARASLLLVPHSISPSAGALRGNPCLHPHSSAPLLTSLHAPTDSRALTRSLASHATSHAMEALWGFTSRPLLAARASPRPCPGWQRLPHGNGAALHPATRLPDPCHSLLQALHGQRQGRLRVHRHSCSAQTPQKAFSGLFRRRRQSGGHCRGRRHVISVPC